MKKEKIVMSDHCKQGLVGIRDTQEMLSGKWKISILGALRYLGKLRFMDMLRHIDGIAPKMLSKELKDLEMNHLVKRTVYDTMPVTVEYELTPQGKSLDKVIAAMADWGIAYRKAVIRK